MPATARTLASRVILEDSFFIGENTEQNTGQEIQPLLPNL
jgi:hypothetical protein